MKSTDGMFELISTAGIYRMRTLMPAPTVYGWVGYVLGKDDTGPLKQAISVHESLYNYVGHYLFALTEPQRVRSDPGRFVASIRDFVRRSDILWTYRGIIWIHDSSGKRFGPFDQFAIRFYLDALNHYHVDNQFEAPIGKKIGKNLSFVVPDKHPIVANARLDVNSDSITVSSAGYWFKPKHPDPPFPSPPLAVTKARIMLVGPAAGSFLMDAVADSHLLWRHMQPGLQFSYGSEEVGQRLERTLQSNGCDAMLEFPALLKPAPESELPMTALFDPLAPHNEHHELQGGVEPPEAGRLRSMLAFDEGVAMPSWFRTTGGNALSLRPIVGLDQIGGLPKPHSGGFAFVETPQGDAALTLAGEYEILPTADTPGPTPAPALMCGFSGSEWIAFQYGDCLRFDPTRPAYAPAFPFHDATIIDPASGAVGERLEDRFRTAWAAVIPKIGGDPTYSAEPDGAALYGLNNSADLDPPRYAVLDSMPPHALIPRGLLVPLVPYAGVKAKDAGAVLAEFESQILSPTRKALITDALIQRRRSARAARLRDAARGSPGQPQTRTTPQGLLAEVDAQGDYTRVVLAQDATPKQMAFVNPTVELQEALRSNQLFLVAVNDRHIDAPSTEALFENALNIGGWNFRAQVGAGVTPTSYRNVMILKFCEGTLQDRVKNPNRWVMQREFSLAVGQDEDDTALAYTGLSQWLQTYIADAIKKADSTDAATARLYANFKRLATDPKWQGVIVLGADIVVEDLPKQIQGLATGIDLTQFTAHHFGTTISTVKLREDGRLAIEGVSSSFALVDYEYPPYVTNVATGGHPDSALRLETRDGYAFKVFQLQALFESSVLTAFNSRVQLTCESLFGSRVTSTCTVGGVAGENGVVLNGRAVDQNGVTVYVFQQANAAVFGVDSNVLNAVSMTSVQLNTLRTEQETIVHSRFVIWGTLNFAELKAVDGTAFDVLSFGSAPPVGSSSVQGPDPRELEKGLGFSNLQVDMRFPLATPAAVSFAFNAREIAPDLASSSARPQSLFKGFSLQLDGFLQAPEDQKPSDAGYLPVRAKDLALTELKCPWYGVTYKVTMGTPGALVSAAGFDSRMLIAWSASTKRGEAQNAVFLGLRLPGAAPGASMFSLQGVLKVSVQSIELTNQPIGAGPDRFFNLVLKNIGVSILGIKKLPSPGSIQFFLFGKPSSMSGLGWYAAYNAKPDKPRLGSGLRYVALESAHRHDRAGEVGP